MNTPHSPAGRRALVMGLGRFGGGLGAARWLADAGAQVVVTDTAPAEQLAASVAQLAPWVERGSVALHLGGHRAEDFESAEWVIANPAVRPDSPWLARARAAGARLTSEVELYLERTTAQVVAVTGTQGKSSTVTFTAALLRAAGRTAAAGGNLGGSLLEALSFERPGQVRVVELSSYQLEALSPTPPAQVAALAVTNVLADHLDRHGDLAGYAAAKARILELAAPGPPVTCAPPAAADFPTAPGATCTGTRSTSTWSTGPSAAPRPWPCPPSNGPTCWWP
jgi:UDP-N-acetylmuramoylalanine--D-glutamate ligase